MKALMLVAVFAVAPVGAAQDPLFQPKTTEKAEKKEVVYLTAWPKLEADAATVKTDIERLRKAGTPEMGEQADAALTKAGAAIVPQLLPVLGREKSLEARLRVETVLEKITGPEHTRLLAPFFADKAREVRIWALARCAGFPDAGVQAPAVEAYTKAKAALAKDPKAEGADVELYCAALCATAAGSHAALESIAQSALEQWGKKGPELRLALEAVRDEESTTFASKLAADPDRKKKVAGLNLLAGCGTKSALALVKVELDNNDNSIRIAAINALRGIVDGELPIANLPVFEAIELAKKWKARS
ncbi:MAG: hypothetical protein IT454_16170 [Planctomycetes bacterium]|nr:hypothetical protein [Planctomycetota bacterium]